MRRSGDLQTPRRSFYLANHQGLEKLRGEACVADTLRKEKKIC